MAYKPKIVVHAALNGVTGEWEICTPVPGTDSVAIATSLSEQDANDFSHRYNNHEALVELARMVANGQPTTVDPLLGIISVEDHARALLSQLEAGN